MHTIFKNIDSPPPPYSSITGWYRASRTQCSYVTLLVFGYFTTAHVIHVQIKVISERQMEKMCPVLTVAQETHPVGKVYLGQRWHSVVRRCANVDPNAKYWCGRHKSESFAPDWTLSRAISRVFNIGMSYPWVTVTPLSCWWPLLS